MRAYVGYGRLDTAAQAQALDDLYEQLWVYYNLFQPVLHLTEKAVVEGKLKRTWDTAATPYHRLLATTGLTPAQQARLAALQELTNPRQLRREINTRLGRLWATPPGPALDLTAHAAD